MSDNCLDSMAKGKKEDRKDKDSDPHFVKVIDYAKNEPWRTDIILGQKGSKFHSHLALSGSVPYYFETEDGKIIIEEGNTVMNTSQSQLDYKPNISKEPQHPEQSLSKNEDN